MDPSRNFLMKWVICGSEIARFIRANSLDTVISQAVELAEKHDLAIEIHQSARMLGVVKKNLQGKYRFEPCMESWAV